MSMMWDFFEKLDEMVYVSDIDTYQLIYMNKHLRDSLGYSADEEYVGKLCYKVLQGMDAPCAFCTNCRLKEGEFVSWTHKNPVLNKRVLLKDSLINVDGKNYRIELAIDADSENTSRSTYYHSRQETILNGCIQQIFSTASAEESIQKMLNYIGKTFSCDRSYIFEINHGIASNTYEWCAPHAVPQIDCLQNVPLSSIDWWLSLFSQDKVTVIKDLEAIRTEYPESYAILKPQDIHCLAAGPIKSEEDVIGFIGVDNPDPQMMTMIEPFLNVIGYFTCTLLKRRELVKKLHNLSYHDQLTGAYNRHALNEYFRTLKANSLGVLYFDISGLKQINDAFGHEEGDKLIRQSFQLLKESLDTHLIFRIGGDEFIAFFPDSDEPFVRAAYNKIQQKIQEGSHHIAAGMAWSDQRPLELEKILLNADKKMYEDKREYYLTTRLDSSNKPSQSDQSIDFLIESANLMGDSISPLHTFLSTADYDVEAMFQSVAQDNDSSYFFLGDMQQDLFYISDNMREDFGFESNLVRGLLRHWSKRICSPEFQDLYWQDISAMLREKRTIHDLRYRVRDAHGNTQWIRSYGILKWNEDKTKPLFFSGRATHQDINFVVDPITGFPRESSSFQQLETLRKNNEKTLLVGFSFNGITETNGIKGREYGDKLLKSCANALMEALSWKMNFYRLEGARCFAILNPLCLHQEPEVIVGQMRDTITACYESMDIPVQDPCSFGLMEYPQQDMGPEDLMDNLVSLIRVAKQETGSPYVEYANQNIQRIKQMSNMVLVLNQDVANNMEHFRVVIQPVVAAGTGAPIGGEVLLRWSFQGKDVSPGIFIPLLEKNGLIKAVGRWVFEQAVCNCMRLCTHVPDFYLTFNVSLHQLSDTQLLPFMKQTLKKYNFDGSHLVAELTESSLDEQPEHLIHFVKECDKMGIRIALDDFGSGYSSLRMLLQYPSSIIKLDRSLVQEVTESKAKLDFIRSIVFACHQFGKTVCMEGVEQEDQNQIIRDTGCDMIQGFYYYRPMELSDVYRLIGQDNQDGLTRGEKDDA